MRIAQCQLEEKRKLLKLFNAEVKSHDLHKKNLSYRAVRSLREAEQRQQPAATRGPAEEDAGGQAQGGQAPSAARGPAEADAGRERADAARPMQAARNDEAAPDEEPAEPPAVGAPQAADEDRVEEEQRE